jgi:hypothetical protein
MEISTKFAPVNELLKLTETVFTCWRSLLLAIIVFSWPRLLLGQHIAHASPKLQEQSGFNYELEIDPIQRPVKLTSPAINTLSKDERVASCLEHEGLRPEQLPSNWFIASEIGLAGSGGRDLVVLPGDRLPETPAGEPSQNACLVGANTAQFWVLRKMRKGFTTVLSQIAHGLEVQQSKTNGLRDIRLDSVVGGYADTVDYKFDGQSYEMTGRSSELIGAEAPHDLSGYETREPLVQQRGQPSEPILTTARGWIWKRWKAHKLSYLKVRIIADDNTEEICTYFVNKSESLDWQVVLKVHRIRSVLARSAKTHWVIENELLIASKLQRIKPTTDDSPSAGTWPESEDLHNSDYKLEFLDYSNRTVATL